MSAPARRVLAEIRRPLRNVGALATLVSMLVGCRIDEVSSVIGYSGPANTCVDSCSDGASCIDGSCQASETAFDVVLEITPPSTSTFAPDVTFDVPIARGQRGTGDEQLPKVVSAQADLIDTSTIAAGVELARTLTVTRQGTSTSPTVQGLASPTSSATWPADVTAQASLTPLLVQPGQYVGLLQPSDPADLARVPPIAIPANTFVPGASPTPIVTFSGAVQTYAFTLTSDGTTPLDASSAIRDVALYDAATGLRVSTVASTCTTFSTATVAMATSAISPTLSVRVSPSTASCPTETPAAARATANAGNDPTYELDLQALAIESGTGTAFDAALIVPESPSLETVTGNTSADPSEEGLSGALLFRAQHLDVESAQAGHALLSARTVSATNGAFVVSLPTGSYDVEFVPDSPSVYAILTTTVVVARDADGTTTLTPSTLTVEPQEAVDAAIDGNGRPFGTGSTLELTPSVTAVASSAIHTRGQELPLQGAATVSLTLDPGVYDLVAQLPSDSGFPWIVAPSVTVPAPTLTSVTFHLGTLTPSPPVPIGGFIVDPDRAPVAGARVRALALIVGSDASTPVGAVAIGETTTAGDGSYSLLLPSAFTPTLLATDSGDAGAESSAGDTSEP